jgi:NTE family protein
MNQPLAFVLGGGGARGALQVGALRALLEAHIQPDLLVGTSIGAVNAAALATRGVAASSVALLVEDWRAATAADLLPSNALRLAMRAMLDRAARHPDHHLRDFFVAHGLTPDLRFRDIRGVRLIVVATDLNTGRAVLYGQDPRQSVLEGILASTALPPWMPPLEKEEQWLMDGGVVSNLPIEPAVAAGAAEIIALDLTDPRGMLTVTNRLGVFLDKLITTVGQRQVELEMTSATAHGVPVRRILLRAATPVPLWDFSRTNELIRQGYEIARQAVAHWRPEHLLRRQMSLGVRLESKGYAAPARESH